MYESSTGEASIILTGDSLITRRMDIFGETSFLALTELLRGSDAAITNVEMMFHDYEASPTLAPGGAYMRADPAMLDQLRWLGITMFATANNHIYDYGEAGVLIHLDHLNASGVPHAGIGRTLGEAREPAYLDTRHGRVALLSLTSSGTPAMIAGHQWRDGRGRPGANMLRYTSTYTVDRDLFDGLRRLRDHFGLDQAIRKPGRLFRDHSWGQALQPDTKTEFYLGDLQSTWQYPLPDGCRIKLGSSLGRTLIPFDEDLEEILQRVRDARRMADYVVVSMHNHESGDTLDDPSDMAIAIAHAVIDAGADIFHGHGPHRDRGIEIYRGRPIFYSLGHFVFQNDTILRQGHENFSRSGLDRWQSTPADFYDARSGRERDGEMLGHAEHAAGWQDIVATVRFEGDRATRVELHPIELGHGLPRSQRGRPMLARPAAAQEIIERFQKLSRRFGTTITPTDGIGMIDLASQT